MARDKMVKWCSFWPLSKGQRIALYIGGVVLCGMLFFPPWRYSVFGQTRRSYWFVFAPPDVVTVRQVTPSGDLIGGAAYIKRSRKIDVVRLAIQCLVVVVLTGVAAVVLGRPTRGGSAEPKPLTPEEASALLDQTRREAPDDRRPR